MVGAGKDVARLAHVGQVIIATRPPFGPFVERQEKRPKGHSGGDAVDDSTANVGPSVGRHLTFASLPYLEETTLADFIFIIFSYSVAVRNLLLFPNTNDGPLVLW